MSLDGDARVAGVVGDAEQVLGVPSAWFIGRAVDTWLDDAPDVGAGAARGWRRGKLTAGRCTDQPVAWREVTDTVGRWLLVRDARAEARLEAAVARVTGLDPVTGLLSRAALLGELQRELARAHRYRRPLAVAQVRVLDLDDAEGASRLGGRDGALEIVARSIEGLLRGADTLGRLHADTFWFVLPETDATGVARLAERLHEGAARLELMLDDGVWRPSLDVQTTTVRRGDSVIDLEGRLERLTDADAPAPLTSAAGRTC